MGRIGHEWKDTQAARMLTAALEDAKAELGLSIRKIAQRLDYKQSTVLSHMANGRSPVPIERAEEFARVLRMQPSAFLEAVVEQRYPDVDWRLMNQDEYNRKDALGRELEELIGKPLSELNEHQRRTMKEVADDPQPQLRWLTELEASAARRLANENKQQEDFATSQEDIDEILADLAKQENLEEEE